MPVEILGILHYCNHSEIFPQPFSHFDNGFIRDCAKAHEDNGFDRVLIANSSHRPDSIPIATYAAAATERLKFMIAHRPGFVAPTMAARMLAVVDQVSDGRCGVHIITGGSDIELEADGDFLSKETRYRRSREYVQLLRKTWSSAEPFDHEGEFYRLNGAYSDVKPVQKPGIPVFWGGTSPEAVEFGAEVADVYALPGFGLDRVAAIVKSVREAAVRFDRQPEFLLSIRVIVGQTEAAALDYADSLLRVLVDEVHDNGRIVPEPGETRDASVQRHMAEFREAGWNGEVWSAFAKVPLGRPALNCLVGSTEQLLATLMRYYEVGVSRFILGGYRPIEDAITIGRDLIPSLRSAVADYDEKHRA